AGHAHDQRSVDQLLIEPRPKPADDAVLAERLPLIAGEDYERIVESPQFAHAVEQFAQPAVNQRYRSRISPAEAEELSLADHLAHGPGRHVNERSDFFDLDLRLVLLDQVSLLAGFELVRLDRDILVAVWQGRVPRPVRAEDIEPEQEWVFRPLRTLEPGNCRL